MHDPSTVIAAGDKFYVYATGNGLPAFESDDGWTWRRTGSVMQGVPGGKPGPTSHYPWSGNWGQVTDTAARLFRR